MSDPFRHEALPHGGHEQLVGLSVSVLRDGLDRDERLLFLARRDKVRDVRDALGSDADDIHLVWTDEHARNPGRVVTMLQSFMAEPDVRRCLAVCETLSAGRSGPGLSEAQLADGLLSAAAVQAWPMSVLCLYDVDALPADVVSQMRRTHPVVRGESNANADYDPLTLGEMFAAALPTPPAGTMRLDIAGAMLTEMRMFVRSVSARFDLHPIRTDDLVLAANEVVTNSVRNAGGKCWLAMWSDGSSVWCEVRDRGLLADPLVGRFTPDTSATGGRGLWLTHHLCDLVQIRSSEHSGTVVRMAMDR